MSNGRRRARPISLHKVLALSASVVMNSSPLSTNAISFLFSTHRAHSLYFDIGFAECKLHTGRRFKPDSSGNGAFVDLFHSRFRSTNHTRPTFLLQDFLGATNMSPKRSRESRGRGVGKLNYDKRQAETLTQRSPGASQRSHRKAFFAFLRSLYQGQVPPHCYLILRRSLKRRRQLCCRPLWG